MTAIDIIVADSFYKRLRGWGVCNPIDQDAWLWLTPCRSVHTMMMRESLTLVYLDRHHRVCEVLPEIKPWRVHACMRAVSVLESSRKDVDALHKLIPHLEKSVERAAKKTQTR